MRELKRLIHSPHHLFSFEVCGRLLSFTRAAQELGVSQPAVSLAMRQLEAAMGIKLFRREHRSVKLTEPGQKLFDEVSSSLFRIHRVVDELKHVPTPGHVTMSVSTAFANYWMVPRLSTFHEAHPDIDLRMQVVDKDIDLEEPAVSLGIRNCVGPPVGYNSVKIALEVLIPIASTHYLQNHGRPSNVADLANHSLIHLEEPYRKRATWMDWFRGMGHAEIANDKSALNKGTRLNDYALVVQAATASEGIALGWKHIVQNLLNQGVLEIALEQSWSSHSDTWLIWSKQIELTPQTAKVRDWLISIAEQELNH